MKHYFNLRTIILVIALLFIYGAAMEQWYTQYLCGRQENHLNTFQNIMMLACPGWSLIILLIVGYLLNDLLNEMLPVFVGITLLGLGVQSCFERDSGRPPYVPYVDGKDEAVDAIIVLLESEPQVQEE